MRNPTKAAAFLTAASVLFGAMTVPGAVADSTAAAASESIEAQMEIGTMGIAGGGFVSGIVTGKTTMYARTDVGGAYKYNYDTGNWDQLMAFIDENDRGYLSIDAMCIDPNDEDTVYMLAGCAYFSDAKTAIFRSRDGGKTFDEIDVTQYIQVHGNGQGRQCGEAIAVDPDNSDIIYCGGDATAGESALIMSKDGGDTWEPVKGYDDLGMFSNSIKWPTWTEHMARCVTNGEYNTQNGVAGVQILDGKVYVYTSIKGTANIHVADVGSDNFEVLSEDLPTAFFPSRINLDADGNLLIAYAGALTFEGGGALYKYDVKTGQATDITPEEHAYGAVYGDPADANKLIATSCDFKYSQLWSADAWDNDGVAWGSQFFRSTDGGATWESITPGNTKVWGGPLQADYLQDGGRPWIRGYAVHWSGAMVLDPRDTNRFLITSGNGVFACDNTWDELPVVYFESDGIEEVVALDMVSIPGKNPISVIGDYDGFEHLNNTDSVRIAPSMSVLTTGSASTSAIAYCPQNTDVMIRCAEGSGHAYYTLDGGKTWNKASCPTGGKAAITQLEDGSYRFLKSSGDNATTVSYSDDLGQTWTVCEGIDSAYGSKNTYMLVEPNDPSIVYAYATYFNSSWHYSKPEPTIDDACYKLYVSHDYGKTFTKAADVAMYDMCDSAGRIAHLGEGELVLGAGWYGAYHVTDYGKNIEKLDNVFYCKTIGYGAPEKAGGVNTLYMYGQPTEEDAQGVYRSTDAGKTWVAINTQKLYGGTGNGNYLVGDMNTFGTVYMSTVGCGIVYMAQSGTDPIPGTTTTTTKTTTATTTTTTNGSSDTTTTSTTVTETTTGTTTTSGGQTTVTTTTESTPASTSVTDDFDVLYGDVNLDGKISILDQIYISKSLAKIITLNQQQIMNADCCKDNMILSSDASILLKYLIRNIEELPVIPE